VRNIYLYPRNITCQSRKELRMCSFHYWKERAEAVKVLQPWPVCCAGKCCFKFLYKSLCGNKKPQHCRPKSARI